MILNVVIPIPINTGGIASVDVPRYVTSLIIASILCIILGAILSYFAIRKCNKKIDEYIFISKNEKIKYREIFNPQAEMKHPSLDNALGSVLLCIGYAGPCMMAFIAIVLWITNLIIG